MFPPKDSQDWPSLIELLERAAAAEPDRAALVMPDTRISYAELRDQVHHIARGLRVLGVRPGENVGLLIPNSFELVEALFAASMIGAIPVPINARYRSRELEHVLVHAELVCVLTSDEAADHVDFAALLTEVLPELARARDPYSLNLVAAPLLRTAVMLRGAARTGFLGRNEFDELAGSVRADLESPKPAGDEAALILYTSGTTAKPKGCILTHEAVTRGAISRMSERLATDEPDVSWGGGPLFHIGQMQALLACIAVRGTYVFDRFFDAGRALAMLEREGVTTAWVWFPTIMQALLDLPDFNPNRLALLRSLMLIWPPALIDRMQEMLPWSQVINVCGMTEMSGVYAMTPLDEPKELRAHSGGVPLEGIEVRILGEDGADLPRGVPGELAVRGYLRTAGYFRAEDLTRAAIDEDGWFHTQDLYEQNERGGLVFRGRLKDMLKVGGENVSAVEVEALLATHPAVRAVEVVGRPDARLDEVPVAFIELRPGFEGLRHTELIEYCDGRIARYKVPREIHFMSASSWPMSATKVDKNQLRRWLKREETTFAGPVVSWPG